MGEIERLQALLAERDELLREIAELVTVYTGTVDQNPMRRRETDEKMEGAAEAYRRIGRMIGSALPELIGAEFHGPKVTRRN